MANMCSVKFWKKPPLSYIKTTINTINADHFGNQLTIGFMEDGSCFQGWQLEISEKPTLFANIWATKSGKTFTWKRYTEPFTWWTVSCLMSRFVSCTDIEAEISEDGQHGLLKPNFHVVYPTPTEWVIALKSKQNLSPEDLEEERRIFINYGKVFLPKLWKIIS